MDVIIAGSRNLTFSVNQLDDLINESNFNVTSVISGMARGADLSGYNWAKAKGILVKEFPADWGGEGRIAGLSRNLRMLEHVKENNGGLIMLFDGISPGSSHCLKNAQAMSLPRFVKVFGNGREDRCLSCEDSELVFVFGSNEKGAHGKSSAKHASIFHGAVNRQGFGIQGSSFAVPTKSGDLKILSLNEIEFYIKRFISFANMFPQKKFYITRIGCGLSLYKDEQIAPFFADIPNNCILNETWQSLLKKT